MSACDRYHELAEALDVDARRAFDCHLIGWLLSSVSADVRDKALDAAFRFAERAVTS